MAELNDWQWAIGAAVLMTALVVGGWLSNREAGGSADFESEKLKETTSPTPSLEINELTQLRQQLEARECELKDAREEAELTLLQLHQVQEELEHYFLESRDLQQKLDAVKTEAPMNEKISTITPEQQDKLKRINARLLALFKTLPASANRNTQAPSDDRLEALVQRQQNALRRFKALQQAS